MPDRADWLKRTIIKGVRDRSRPSPPNDAELVELKGKCDRLPRGLAVFPEIEEVKRGFEIARDRGLTKTQLKQARKIGDRLVSRKD